MAEKLLLFGIGYILGTRAGRERYEQLVTMAKEFAQRDDVQTVVALAVGFIEERASVVGGSDLRRAA